MVWDFVALKFELRIKKKHSRWSLTLAREGKGRLPQREREVRRHRISIFFPFCKWEQGNWYYIKMFQFNLISGHRASADRTGSLVSFTRWSRTIKTLILRIHEQRSWGLGKDSKGTWIFLWRAQLLSLLCSHRLVLAAPSQVCPSKSTSPPVGKRLSGPGEGGGKKKKI